MTPLQSVGVLPHSVSPFQERRSDPHCGKAGLAADVLLRRIAEVADTYLRPPVIVMRMVKMLTGVVFVVHTCLCCFWLVKEASSTELEIQDFLVRNGLEPDAGVFDRYVLGMYFINTVITTVGFGDIYPENSAERLFASLVMYIGTMVFGILLSEVQTAIAQHWQSERARNALLIHVKKFVRAKEIDRALELRILQWVDFDHSSNQEAAQQHHVLSVIPRMLRRAVYAHLHRDQLYKIPFFGILQSFFTEDFLTDLYAECHVETFCTGIKIVARPDPFDRLYIVMEGIVEVQMEKGRSVSTMRAGDFFGEAALLLDDAEWSTSAFIPAQFRAGSMTKCLVPGRSLPCVRCTVAIQSVQADTSRAGQVLTRQAFQDVLHTYPKQLQEEVGRVWQPPACPDERVSHASGTQCAKLAGAGFL